MNDARWYFDFISPFSYLQLPKVREWRARVDITPVPIAFGAVLAHLGQLGPAEIPGKREFTYRFVQWQADRIGMPMRFPAAHPFNSLAALRLCVVAGTTWNSVDAIFDHIWRDGNSAAELHGVARILGIDDMDDAISAPDVKARLRANTESAIADGVFGVPTLRVGNELFWGNDATPMIEDWLANQNLFATDDYQRIAALPIGVQRAR
jgi:2-hydroxychromene-2-carboxylate isomerase